MRTRFRKEETRPLSDAEVAVIVARWRAENGGDGAITLRDVAEGLNVTPEQAAKLLPERGTTADDVVVSVRTAVFVAVAWIGAVMMWGEALLAYLPMLLVCAAAFVALLAVPSRRINGAQ